MCIGAEWVQGLASYPFVVVSSHAIALFFGLPLHTVLMAGLEESNSMGLILEARVPTSFWSL